MPTQTHPWLRAELIAAPETTPGAQLMIPADGIEFHDDQLVFHHQGEIVYVAPKNQLRSITWFAKQPHPETARRKAQWPNHGTRWTDEERTNLQNHLRAGHSWKAISHGHGRSRTGCQQEAVKQGWLDPETLAPTAKLLEDADAGASSTDSAASPSAATETQADALPRTALAHSASSQAEDSAETQSGTTSAAPPEGAEPTAKAGGTAAHTTFATAPGLSAPGVAGLAPRGGLARSAPRTADSGTSAPKSKADAADVPPDSTPAASAELAGVLANLPPNTSRAITLAPPKTHLAAASADSAPHAATPGTSAPSSEAAAVPPPNPAPAASAAAPRPGTELTTALANLPPDAPVPATPANSAPNSEPAAASTALASGAELTTTPGRSAQHAAADSATTAQSPTAELSIAPTASTPASGTDPTALYTTGYAGLAQAAIDVAREAARLPQYAAPQPQPDRPRIPRQRTNSSADTPPDSESGPGSGPGAGSRFLSRAQSSLARATLGAYMNPPRGQSGTT